MTSAVRTRVGFLHGSAVVGSVIALGFSLWSSASAASARPSLESVLTSSARLHSYGGVGLSPSGRYVAFARDGGLFVHDAITKHTRRIAICASCETSEFAWAPQTDQLAVIAADASGQTQVYRATPVGEVTQLTHVRGNLGNPRWSPAGDRIAFLFIKDAPRVPGPLNPAARQVGVISNAFYEQRIAIVSGAGGDVALRSPAATYVYEYDWSPDAKRFVATEANGDGDANWWVAKLALIDTQTGALRTLLKPPLQLANPRWSPDGKTIGVISGLMSDEGITGGDLATVSPGDGTLTNRTDGLHASTSAFEWAVHPQRIIATQVIDGTTAIATFDPTSQARQQRYRGDVHLRGTAFSFEVGSVAVSRDGTTVAAVRESYTAPPAVISGPIGAWHTIDDADANAPRWISSAKSITWMRDGTRVQGWLLAPQRASTKTRAPMIVVPHGGPAYLSLPTFPQAPEAYDAAFTSQGYYVFKPNPRGSYGGGEAFTQANIRDFGGADLQDIIAGVDRVTQDAAIDPQRVGMFGWSYGGFMSMWTVTQTQRFKAAVAGAGIANWISYQGENGIDTWALPYMHKSIYDDPDVYTKMSPLTYIKNVKTPTLVVVGERDAECPAPQSFEFWHALHDLGVRTQLVVYADEGHLFNKLPDAVDVTRRTVTWFDRYLR